MRDYGKVAPTFWTRGSGKALRGNPTAQIVALYLFTSPGASMTGLYYLSLPTVCHETGLAAADVRTAFAALAVLNVAQYDEGAEIVWVPEMAKYQIGEALKSGDKRAKGVEREVATFRGHRFHHDFMARYGVSFGLAGSPFQAPSKPLPGEQEAPSKPLPVVDPEKISPLALAPERALDPAASEAALAGVSAGLPDGPTLHEMARRCAPANSFAAKMLVRLDAGEVLTKGQRDALKKIDGEEHGAAHTVGQPDSDLDRIAGAYAAGMVDATGEPFTPPTDANAQQVFRAALPVHAIGPDRQSLMGDALLAWIRASAAEWRRCVKPEDTRYTSGFVPAKWQTWLNAGRPGSAQPPARLLRPVVHDPIAEIARLRAAPVEDDQ